MDFENSETARLLPMLHGALPPNGQVDDCLHCLVAGNGSLAKTAGLDYTTFAKQRHRDVLAELKQLAINQRAAVGLQTGVWLFWLFNDVYVLRSDAQLDTPLALRRMACRVEWGERWKTEGRCPEPAMKPVADAVTFLKERAVNQPDWRDSAVAGLLGF